LKEIITLVLCLTFMAFIVLPSCGLLASKLPSLVSPGSGIKVIKLPLPPPT